MILTYQWHIHAGRVITLYISRISKHPHRPSYVSTPSGIFCLSLSHFSPTLFSDFFLPYLPFLFSLYHPSHFSFHFPCSSIFLPSLLSFITPSSFFFPPVPSLSPLPLLFSFSHPRSSLPALLEVSTLWVLLTSHLLWCELHICEWMTGKINNPVFPFSLTVGLSNE